MSRSLDGYLMLGWEVETENVANYDETDGLSEDVEAKVTEILGKKWIDRSWCEPIVFPSLYYDCDYMYVGLVLMSDHCDNVEIEGYAHHLLSNAELFEKTACELYETIVGSVPETEPKLMCVTCDG